MATIDIRAAAAADLPAIIALLADDDLGRARDDPRLPLDPGYAAAFAAMAANPNQHLAVATEDGRIVGTLQLILIPGLSNRGAWRGQIEAVRIVSDRRGAGLGAQLVRWAIDRSRAGGCAVVQLTTDKTRVAAHRFYDGLGFTATHLGYKMRL